MNVMTKKAKIGRPPNEDGPSIQVTLKLSPRVYRQVAHLARGNARTVPAEIKEILLDWLKANGNWPPLNEDKKA